MVDFGTAISVVQGAIDCVRGLSAVFKTMKDIGKKIDLLKVQRELVGLEESLIKARDEINILLHENQSLREQLKLKEELALDDDSKVLWKIQNGLKLGPFCSTCYGVNQSLIPLHDRKHESWNCPKCLTPFQTKKGRCDFEEEIENLEKGRFPSF